MSKYSIPYGRQHITQDDIEAVVKTLQSDFLTQGPCIAEFEKNFAEYVNAKFAVAVSNGTAALHITFRFIYWIIIDNSDGKREIFRMLKNIMKELLVCRCSRIYQMKNKIMLLEK